MSYVPSWYVLILLSLAAFRVWRLFAVDIITRPIRERLIGRNERSDATVTGYRPVLDEFIHCPWCSGAWVTIGIYGCWLAWPHGVTQAAVLPCLSAVVGLIAKNLDA